MGSEWVIGALAFLTIGGVLALSVFHFGYQLKHPDNREAAKRVAADRESATSGVSSEGVNGRSLVQRLNDAPGINDRLSARYVGGGFIDVLLERKWAELRPFIGETPRRT